MEKKKSIYLIFLYIMALVTLVSCSSSGSDANPTRPTMTRPDNTSCVAPLAGPSTNGTLSLEKAYPQLADMDSPGSGIFLIALLQSPDNNASWYAVLQDGVVRQFVNSATTSSSSVFIDITDRVSAGGEMGLLGMAFHPDYPSTPYLYLSYTTTTPFRRSVVSQFEKIEDRWQETEIISVRQPYSNHNGGQIEFGADGFLYIGLGDGGSADDPAGHGQKTTSLLGAMLRIDVNAAAPYAIPTDNPFFGNAICDDVNTLFNSENCPEIYAWGLRNPWRWSFDKQTGDLWLGDVGQDSFEEINIINKGKNYGWQVMEGAACTAEGGATCNDAQRYVEPVAAYGHQGGPLSVVGGYVYRGDAFELTNLVGTYLYTDAYSGEILGLRYDDASARYISQSMGTSLTNQNIFSFAQSNIGEIYILATGNSGTGNNIYKLSATNPLLPGVTIADKLSDTGCVDPNDARQPASGLIPFDIISPLWSDNASKQRFMALPNNSTIEVTPEGDLQFPVGTVLVKNFLLDNKLVETRLLMRHELFWSGHAYEWQFDLQGNPVDAIRLSSNKTTLVGSQNWYFPGPAECFNCHVQQSNVALGPELQQLNRVIQYPGTRDARPQLQAMSDMGIFTSALTEEQLTTRKLYAISEDNASFEDRARSYLQSNCAHCHQPGGPTPANMDLRFQVEFNAMDICNKTPDLGDTGLAGIKLFDPAGTSGSPNSMLLQRMQTTESTSRMPPIATEIAHSQAIDVFLGWMDSRSDCL